MKPYGDSNLLVGFYLSGAQNAESLEVIAPAVTAGIKLPVIWVHRMEVSNAFELRVFISRSGGEVRISPAVAAGAQAQFREDCELQSGLLLPRSVPMDSLERQFQDLSLRHTAKHGFRTYDLLHVSAALLLGCDTFWSFDKKCSKLARLEGLKTLKKRA